LQRPDADHQVIRLMLEDIEIFFHLPDLYRDYDLASCFIQIATSILWSAMDKIKRPSMKRKWEVYVALLSGSFTKSETFRTIKKTIQYAFLFISTIILLIFIICCYNLLFIMFV
jgi:inner membrane protein involved in colicin E2 resistance